MRGTPALLVLFSIAAFAQPHLDYPLAPGTRWTYRLHQELAPGVRFHDEDARLASGNVLESTVVAVVADVETLFGRQYARIEHRRGGKPWLTEWCRLTPAGLMVGKSVDYENGAAETIMEPEQKRISATLRPRESWSWQAKDAPVRLRYEIVGPAPVVVPAGSYSAVRLHTTGAVASATGAIQIQQGTWFVPGVGIVKQDTATSVRGRAISHVVLTLARFEKP